MKQLLGSKKHALCEKIAGKKFIVCYANGNKPHYVAECWIDNTNADYVNYKVAHTWPTVRDGLRITARFHPI